MSTATSSQAKHCLTLIDHKQLTVSEMETLLLYLPHLARGVKAGIIPPINDFRDLFCSSPSEYITEIDLGQPLRTMIVAGKYDWESDGITEDKFPVSDVGKKRFRNKLFHFNRDISSEDVIAEIVKAGFAPGDHIHGLAFGATFPREQQKLPIGCLGSCAHVRGSRRVVGLYGYASGRFLRLRVEGDIWHSFWRFLGVQEIPEDC
ncbi:MAG: hypothetical protein A3A26_01655 [Candidatus Zambryskibacteria bacterium RIFCSPLOWO2_01_FULL_47_14]|uniref:Uncharacterized protein n=1 Tax=Candidatus Zambryskibacteria bacterium RIFCSPLOWO2_01_FULL_47_14 TaxID=1802763 RepID=A0A1G2U8J1_9BACT|nr:MAG: hypothetical protein A3A26_01655 [Candidatus Zambryskibacteria bacterium RIFCSPLOWO2_01_FULL_47_14]